jgi:phosphatidylglycerol:prolipoprotein diacylglycerol transferase
MVIAIDPLVVALGPLQLRWGAVFAVLAVLAGLLVGKRWALALGVRPVGLAWLGALVVLAGVVSGRALVLLERPELLRRGVLAVLSLANGGVSLPAAAVGGAGVLFVWAMLSRQSVGAVWAAAGVALLVGEAVGSLGLLLSGEYVGQLLEAPWAVVYSRPESSVPPTLVGRGVQPLVLYSGLWSGLAVGALWAAWRSLTAVERWALPALAFGLGHLLVGYARIEPVWWFGLRSDQLVALGWVVVGGLAVLFQRRALPQPRSAANPPSYGRIKP